MMKINVDSGQLASAHVLLAGIRNGAPRVVMRAINGTLAGVRTDATDEIREKLNVKRTPVFRSFWFRKAWLNNPRGTVGSTGKPLNLVDFYARQLVGGLRVKIYKDGGESTIPHGFVAKLGFDRRAYRRKTPPYRAPWRRTFKYGVLPFRYRFPVELLTGPRVQDVYGKTELFDRVGDKANDRYLKNFDHELSYLLSTLG